MQNLGKQQTEMHQYAIIFLCVMNRLLFGCSAHVGKPIDSLDKCIESLEQSINAAPAQRHLLTIDGQKAALDEFFQQCAARMPLCALPEKFYHFKNEIRTVASQTPDGEVTHTIRVYFNYMSACDPEGMDTKKTHGDIAEFYDTKGEFMGLIVHCAGGLYCPLPYSGYSGHYNQLQRYMTTRRKPIRPGGNF
jgi:hypothetical protein